MGEPTFGVLGPLQVRAAGAAVRLGGTKPRAVLATLLLQPGGFVSLDLLTEVLWPGGAPPSAVANVRTYVRTLRRALSVAGIATDGLHPTRRRAPNLTAGPVSARRGRRQVAREGSSGWPAPPGSPPGCRQVL